MACFSPLKAYRGSDGAIFFTQLARTGGGDTLWLACGQCIGCRLERSRQWAVRCMHEKQLHRENIFVTLTYDDKHLPADLSLDYEHFQLFMKRLRKFFDGERVRFYMCGEYGELTLRPHYHALLFGCDFPDKYRWSGAADRSLWRSPALDRLWSLGACLIGEVTFESAAYCARYICDKVTGDLAEAHYMGRTPEFCHMSLKPGIGAGWLSKFRSDVYPHGTVIVNGRECLAPKYYDKLYERYSALDAQDLRDMREFEASATVADRTYARLAVREQVAVARVNRFSKPL